MVIDRLRKIVLALMMAMILLSPFMQLDSWDNFPVSTDDLELQLIMGLCLIGMFLVFVGVAKLLPELIRSAFVGPAVALHFIQSEALCANSISAFVSPPLRI